MISDSSKPNLDDALANEASLIATLGLDDGASESVDEMDAEMAIEALLDQAGLSQLVIRQHESGSEVITGYFRINVPVGQQRVSWHIPITPPVAALPKCSAEAIDLDARIRFTNIQKFGVRAELVLPTASENEATVLVTVRLAISGLT